MAYTGQGLGYSRLTVPEDGLSQSMQFWGAEAGKRKAAADLANERKKVREEEKAMEDAKALSKEATSTRYDFTAPDAGYESLSDNYRAFSRDAATHYDELRMSYLESFKKGDRLGAEKYADQMEKVKSTFKEQQGAAEKLKKVFDQFAKMDAEGTLSDYGRNTWKMVKGLYNGDTKKTFLNYNRDNISSQWFSSEMGEDGQPILNSITMADVDNGLIAPIEKINIDGEKGMVDNYASNMGEYTREWYTKGRDRESKGYNEFAEEKLTSILSNDLDDNEVKDLAAQFNIATSGLEDPKKLFEAKQKVIEQLRIKIMSAEKIKDSSKLNIEEAKLAETIRSNKAGEAIRRAEANKPKGLSQDEIEYGARRANIENLASSTPDPNFFNSGTFVWGDKTYTATGSRIVGDQIVISTDKGKTISVNRNNTAAVNSLFDAFEVQGDPKKVKTLDKVMNTQPYYYKEFQKSQPLGLQQYAPELFDDSGRFVGGFNAGELASKILEIYPDSEAENVYFGKGDIQVRGVPIYLKGKTSSQIEADISRAMGDSQEVDEYGVPIK